MQLFLCLVTPAFMLFTAIRQLFFPPAEPSVWLGYRSTLAMANVATWKEAQRIWGLAMLKAGATGALAGIACYYLLEGSVAYLASMLLNALFASMTVLWTERTLSRMFDSKGIRKRHEEDLR